MEQAVRIITTSSPVVSLTSGAAAKIRQLLDTEETDSGMALRMAVRPGGCSGFSYEMYFDADVNSDDITAGYEDVHVVVDNKSAELLRGSVLDYKDGLMDSGFSIDNPNVTRSCGCGNSFS